MQKGTYYMIRLRRDVVKSAWADPLVSNSIFIMASSMLMGGLGFAFWIVCARLFSTAQVGQATSLVSAASLLAYVSLLGFNSSLIRYLPSSSRRNEQVLTALACVGLLGILTCLGYVLLLPSITPRLSFVSTSLPLALGFVLLGCASALNLLTDSVFIAYRAAHFNLIIDGCVQGLSKLALPFALVGLGSYGIFAASGTSAVIAVVVSVAILRHKFSDHSPRRFGIGALREMWRYSSASYLANLLNIIPILVLPLIVINRRGDAAAAFFYVTFQIANLLSAVSYAVSQSMFAEGSYRMAGLRSLARKSAFMQAVVMVPGALLLCLLAPWILSLFGEQYRLHATSILIVLSLGTLAVGLNTWTSGVLRVVGRLGTLIGCNVLFVVVVCVVAFVGVGSSLIWAPLAWVSGNLASGLVGATSLAFAYNRARGVRYFARSARTGAHRA